MKVSDFKNAALVTLTFVALILAVSLYSAYNKTSDVKFIDAIIKLDVNQIENVLYVPSENVYYVATSNGDIHRCERAVASAITNVIEGVDSTKFEIWYKDGESEVVIDYE